MSRTRSNVIYSDTRDVLCSFQKHIKHSAIHPEENSIHSFDDVDAQRDARRRARMARATHAATTIARASPRSHIERRRVATTVRGERAPAKTDARWAPVAPHRARVVARSEFEERNGGGRGFVGGLLVGGAVFGALGFLFAPQLSKTLLGGKRALNKALDEESEDELEATRQSLNEKIAALNEAIDNFSDQAESGMEKNVSNLNKELNGMAPESTATEGAPRDVRGQKLSLITRSRAEDTFNCFNQEDCTPKHSNQSLTFFHRVNASLSCGSSRRGIRGRREAPCEDVTAKHNLQPVVLHERRRFALFFRPFAVFTATIFLRASSLFRLALRLFVRRRSVSSNIRRRVRVKPRGVFRHAHVHCRPKFRPNLDSFRASILAIPVRRRVLYPVRVASVVGVHRQRVRQTGRSHALRRHRRHDVRPLSRAHDVTRHAHSVHAVPRDERVQRLRLVPSQRRARRSRRAQTKVSRVVSIHRELTGDDARGRERRFVERVFDGERDLLPAASRAVAGGSDFIGRRARDGRDDDADDDAREERREETRAGAMRRHHRATGGRLESSNAASARV